jgi:quinolinate synthase
MNYTSVDKLGYIDEEVDGNLDLSAAIRKIKEEKNAIILAHYYQRPEVQDVADFVGDSLALSLKAASLKNTLILFAGVKFMAETVKILKPQSKVLITDLNAGCSLSDSCNFKDFKAFIDSHPNHTIVTYVNSSAEVKALSDICCTSSNALNVVKSINEDQPIIFAPDRNLGSYVKLTLNRTNITIWNGYCHVHDQFILDSILDLKVKYPKAQIITHPECQNQILLISDFIGSTQNLLDYTINSKFSDFIVVTEPGIIHQMNKMSPHKNFYSPYNSNSGCNCNECNFMKLNTLKKIYLTLKYEYPYIHLDSELISKAIKPINRMLEIK